MPWSQTLPMDQRTQFIADYLREVLSVTSFVTFMGYRARRPTSGSIVTCGVGRQVLRSIRANLTARRMRLPRRS